MDSDTKPRESRLAANRENLCPFKKSQIGTKRRNIEGGRQRAACGKCTNLQNARALIDIGSTSMDDGEKEIEDCAARRRYFFEQGLLGGWKRGVFDGWLGDGCKNVRRVVNRSHGFERWNLGILRHK
ncbi:hypothetical protein V9T40_000644 [Parthenolecanium corni]|uniref:Uncharacterized protein n=1 Tax=Parthenolecanium corni TaxID=536013 RepID=A0AAN9Y1U0_9HEMI